MAVNPLGMNQGTNSFIRFEDDGGTVNTQVVDVRTLGTLTNLTSGTINSATVTGNVGVSSGTITTGTINNLVSGTINSATVILNSGTINVATVAAHAVTAATITAGTINAATINLGSVGGLAGSAAAVSGNPVYIAGQGGNGTA